MIFQSADEYLFYEGLYDGSQSQSLESLEWELKHWPLFFDNVRYRKFKDVYRDGYLYGIELSVDEAKEILESSEEKYV